MVSSIRLRTGTMWHEYISKLLLDRGATVMQEVRLSPWLPEGWGGRADLLVWDAEARAFDLWDIKTTKGEGLKWIADGAKDEHIWQMSAYWHALRAAKFPMLKKFRVLYLPMNAAEGDMEPIVQSVVPLPKDLVWGVMAERWKLTTAYLDSIASNFKDGEHNWITDKLAPVQPRVQKLYKNGDKYELKLVPHWSTRFCPFPDELCDCNTQGTTKIGEWAEGNYTPRKGYDHIEAELQPR